MFPSKTESEQKTGRHSFRNDVLFLCGRRDLNPYPLLDTPLKRARMPIPPRPHIMDNDNNHTTGW